MHRPSIVAVAALVFGICGAHALAADVACASLLADEVVFAETQMQAGSRVPQRRGHPLSQASPARDNLVALAMVQAVTVSTQRTAESVTLSGDSVARYRAMSLARGADAGIADIGDIAKALLPRSLVARPAEHHQTRWLPPAPRSVVHPRAARFPPLRQNAPPERDRALGDAPAQAPADRRPLGASFRS